MGGHTVDRKSVTHYYVIFYTFGSPMLGSFHFWFFGHFDQETKKSAVIFRQNADFFDFGNFD